MFFISVATTLSLRFCNLFFGRQYTHLGFQACIDFSYDFVCFVDVDDDLGLL
ncbi:hypothetical protein HanPI659440_Chr17g0690841 [Helianthus annuus]|nr:hypothetical protein HanPI659440_Chr17g0690841 [Helianthus annuus]